MPIIISLSNTCLVNLIRKRFEFGTSSFSLPSHILPTHPNYRLQDASPLDQEVRLIKYLACALGYPPSAFDLGPRKEADGGIRPSGSLLPSVVLEVGDSESLRQLRMDARLWLERIPQVTISSEYLVPIHSQGMLQVQLVVLLSIDRPNIAIELWRGFPPSHPPHSPAAHHREAQMVWNHDWTNTATPLYILLSDIFRGQVPVAYGNNDRVFLNSAYLRQCIIDSW